MSKKLLLIALVLAISKSISAQTEYGNSVGNTKKYLIRETLGSSGESKTIKTGNGEYFISQSIGQSSVIGTFSNKKYTIRQGYQQPLISMTTIKLSIDNLLKANVYPNPFEQSVNVLFDEFIDNELNVTIHSLNGSLIVSKIYSPAQSINIPLEFLQAGTYILKISYKQKKLMSKIVKN